ncbi:MAG: hypothetical protein J6Q27_03400, partial [Clostridia bacterium]|nr:hypothetical protein [Clostridia bacterium]
FSLKNNLKNTKLKEEIRAIRISSVFIALCFRQTEPLGVHTYAFGAHPIGASVCLICTIFRPAQKGL